MRSCIGHPLLYISFSLLFLAGEGLYSQAPEKRTYFGIQYRPIIGRSELLNTGPVSTSNEEFTATLTPTLGHDFGMVIRWGIGDQWAIETGIDQVRRNFEITVEDEKSPYSESMDFGMLAYQLPVKGLLYVQLGETLYMNVSAGAVAEIFPTNWSTAEDRSRQITQRYNWLQGAFSANVGFEYRSPNSGAFYLGGTFHRPLTRAPIFGPEVGLMRVEYRRDQRHHEDFFQVPGNFITLDLKYFFPFRE